jgi:Acetyltransferase (GNAT) domain
MSGASDLSVRPLGDAGDEIGLVEYQRILAQSPCSCLFHEPSFLAYHPRDRFTFKHLLVLKGKQAVALLTGGMIERDGVRVYRSPLGASFGGPVLAPRLPASDTLALLGALQDYARAEGWAAVELVPPPAIYRRDGSDTLGFCLQASGFGLASRMLCSALILKGAPPRFASLYRSRNVTKTRAAQRLGIEVVIGGRERLDEFEIVFDATYRRHGVTPTHTIAEIADLMLRLPDRFQIVIARHEERPVAGLFLMHMADAIANAFYICSTSEDTELNAGLAMFAWVIDRLGDAGLATLDLGPSSMDDGSLNRGVCFFKEGLGAIGYCRDRWTWSVA